MRLSRAAWSVSLPGISMGSTVLPATLSGLHLALLEFSYFYLLLLRVGSTSVTCLVVALAWMTGAVAGLSWRRLNPATAVIAGVLSYYGAGAAVLAQPAGVHVWPIAAAGIGIGGLLAGHVFVFLLPAMTRADRLFFHTNNGFALGIVAGFAGMALLGERFLFWIPLFSGMVLLALLTPLEAAQRRALAGDDAAVASPHPDLAVRGVSTRSIRVLAVLACALNVLFPLALLAYAGWRREAPWTMFWGEGNAITWFSAGQLLLIAAIAYLNNEAAVILDGLGEAQPRRWIWLVMALGFVFLAADELFQVHEAIRDDILRPRGLFSGIPLVKPGDVTLLFYAGIGMAAAVFLVGELHRHPPALGLFVAAVALTTCILSVDALDKDIIGQWPMPRFWTSVFEEVGEIWGQLLFLLSFLVVLGRRIERAQRLGTAGGS